MLVKKKVTSFFVAKFFFRSFVNNLLELLIFTNNFLSTSRAVDSFGFSSLQEVF